MDVILLERIEKLGSIGDVVKVKNGYARNFLMRRGLATGWTKGFEKQVSAIQKGREIREVKSLDEAKGLKGQLESKPVKVPAKAGKSGRLFGAVTQGDVADAVKAAGGPSLDRRKIELLSPIKSTGMFEALVRLHAEVQASIKLEVVAI